MIKKSLILLFIGNLLLISISAQTNAKRGEDALNNGNYTQAASYFLKAFEDNPNEEVKSQLIKAQILQSKYNLYKSFISLKKWKEAKSIVDEMNKVLPDNSVILSYYTSIATARGEKVNETNFIENGKIFTLPFWGNAERQKTQGGYRLYGGYTIIDMDNFSSMNGYEDSKAAFHGGIYYNTSRYLPITLGVEYAESNIMNLLSFYATYNIFAINSKRFTVDVGGGYSYGFFAGADKREYDIDMKINKKQPFVRLGATYMFDPRWGGGIKYTYNYDFSENNFPYHSISYILGKNMSGLAICVGLVFLLK